MSDITIQQTNLSTTTDVIGTLDWKLAALDEAGGQLQSGIADYIGLAMQELQGQEDQLKQLESEIKDRKNYLKEQKEAILEGSAVFMEELGVKKLCGNLVSSITVVGVKPESTKKKVIRDATAAEVDDTLLTLGLAHLEEVAVPATKSKIRVNRRRVHVPEIEDK